MRLTDTLAAGVAARLDARLAGTDRPIALALSGGGDSMALLHLAADWARVRGRRLIALTVDHGLNPDSAAWTGQAGEAARALGLEWRGLAWAGDKPASGLAAAARRARHARLAEAAREAGCRVILMAHTADDIAEADWMRARGSTLGRVAEWAPSPVWPEGRDIMLLRPLLGQRRAALRDLLRARGANWIDDPANDDPASLRARARRALSDGAPQPSPETGPRPGPHSLAEEPEAFAGVLRLPLDAAPAALAAAVVCAGGGEATPRGARLAALSARAASGQPFVATLAGARAESDGRCLIVCRDAGEGARGHLPVQRLAPNLASVWDGRYEVTVDRAGLSAAPLKGRLKALPPEDRALIAALPAAARPGLPVLIGPDRERPLLAWRAARVRCLVPGRYRRAVGGSTQARDLETPAIGEMAPESLSR